MTFLFVRYFISFRSDKRYKKNAYHAETEISDERDILSPTLQTFSSSLLCWSIRNLRDLQIEYITLRMCNTHLCVCVCMRKWRSDGKRICTITDRKSLFIVIGSHRVWFNIRCRRWALLVRRRENSTLRKIARKLNEYSRAVLKVQLKCPYNI